MSVQYILECKGKLLNDDRLFIVDPAMAEHGKMYKSLSNDIVIGMKEICMVVDYIIPNITEACFLTGNIYKEEYDEEYINKLLNDLYKLGCKNVILTGISYNTNEIGAVAYDGKNKITYLSTKIEKSYHGTGDIF